MSGVRLHHPTERGVVLTVEHPLRPYTAPLDCNICAQVHTNKTYHLTLDGEGFTIVSDTVFRRLREIGLGGLVLVNEVMIPPPLVVGMRNGKVSRVVRAERI